MIRAITIKGHFSTFRTGKFIAMCPTGRKVEVTYSQLQRLAPITQGCGGKDGCPRCKPYRRRSPVFAHRTRRGDPRHIGMVYGRFTIIAWIAGKGWQATCECGETEFFPKTHDFALKSITKCPHVTTKV